MLIHIVVWKYNEESADSIRREHVSMLRALSGVIPEIRSLKVGSDVLGLDRSYDSGLVAEFLDREALEAYTVHEAHQRVAALGKEISAQVASVDFFE